MKPIRIYVAENNDCGYPSGKTSVIDFNNIARFESRDIRGYAFNLVDKKHGVGRFRFNRKLYPFISSSSHAGSMIYNSYLLEAIVASELINDLNKSVRWYDDSIDLELSDHLKQAPIFPADLSRIYQSYLS